MLLIGALLAVTSCGAGEADPGSGAKGSTVSTSESDRLESRRIELAPVESPNGRVLLRLEGIRHSRRSFQVRFFVDSPEADAATPTEGNRRYGGDFWMYGHGMPGEKVAGEAAVLEGFVREAGKVLEPFDANVDITKALADRPPGESVRITIVVLDEDGEPLPHETFKFDRARLEAQER